MGEENRGCTFSLEEVNKRIVLHKTLIDGCVSIIVMFFELSVLTAPIHCRQSNGEQVM